MLLDSQRFKEDIKWEIKKKYLETNENGYVTHQTLWDAAKEVLRGKFTVINT